MQKELTRKQFELMVYLTKQEESCSQRSIAEALNMSVGTVNKVMKELTTEGYVRNNMLTPSGLTALEPYRVQRAILMAAGFGSRMVPITLNTPKPLVRVKGVRIIDTLIDALLAADITEIYVVRGYLAEQFDQLLYKYPMIKFIDNPSYNEANNISSAMFARHLLRNAYVMEADLVLYNPDIITKYQYTSNYLGVPVEKTDDWCFETKNKVITALKQGGVNCYHEFGISYWNEEDGAKLCEDIKTVYEMPGGKERYWDQAPLEFCKDHYQIEVRCCTFDDVIEIDSFSDLKKLDKTYR